MKEKENKLNEALYVAKMFAVISIVLAHTFYNTISNEYVKSALSIYQVIGVYIFLILSGYFFNKNKYTGLLQLIKDKFIKIGIPWLILGMVTFGASIIYSSENMVDFLGFINYLLGNGSYLYYLTVLLMCYVVTYCLPQKRNIYIYANIIKYYFSFFNKY